jgi:Rrf2 family protein
MLGRELAGRANIPANYLSKIMWALGNAGIISATRGNGGGYRLTRKAAEIHLFEIVEVFDRGRTSPYEAHEAWTRARQAYLEFLHSTSLADVSNLPEGRA